MNISTEQLDNHSVRLTVEVDSATLENAKREAIRAVSGKVNIPGFRKGKAPAAMITRYVGEAYILEEAIESLGQKLYREALEQSELEPAAPGSMDDFKLEPPTFIFTVPLAPSVVLNENYRDIRLEYVEPVIGEAEVEAELRNLQRELAESVESQDGAEVNDRLTADLHSFFVETESEIDAETDVHERKEKAYIHRHGAVIPLLEGAEEPLAPGVTAQLVGVKAGETRTFRITFPTAEQDANINPELAGKTVEFVIAVEKVEKLILPDIDEALAAKISERFNWDQESDDFMDDEDLFDDEDDSDLLEIKLEEELIAEAEVDQAEVDQAEVEASAEDSELTEGDDDTFKPLTLDEVRVKLKDVVARRELDKVRDEYANKVLEQVIEGAQVKFHDASVEAEIDDMVEDLKERLRQNRLDLDTYLRQTGRTIEEIRADYREPAANFLRRSLAVREFARAEKLQVTQDDIQTRLIEVLGNLDSEIIKELGLMRDERFINNLANNLMTQKIEARAIAIGKGEAPDLTANNVVAEAATEEASASEAEATSTDETPSAADA